LSSFVWLIWPALLAPYDALYLPNSLLPVTSAFVLLSRHTNWI
jgi:hypothetical protein